MQEPARCKVCNGVLLGDPEDPYPCEDCKEAMTTRCNSCSAEIPEDEVLCEECKENLREEDEVSDAYEDEEAVEEEDE